MRDVIHGQTLFILWWKIRLVFITLFCSVISVALAILVLPSVIVLYSIYMVVYLHLKIKMGDKIDRANGMDIMYSLDYPSSNPYMNSVSTVDGDISLDELKENGMRFLSPKYVEECGHIYKRAWKRMETHYGYTFFVDDPNFDVENHIIIVTDKDLFGNEKPEEYFQRIMSYKGEDSYGEFIEQEGQLICQRMMEVYGSKRVDKDKPQWEVIYYKHPGRHRATILFHGHHCIADGVSVLRYFLEKYGDKKVDYTLPYTFYQDQWYKRWALNLLSFFMMPWGAFRLTYHTGENPLHGQELSGEKMYIRSKLYPAIRMKEIKNNCDCSMITLLLNSMAYALRCNYRRKGTNARKTLILVPVPLQDFKKEPVFKNDHGLQGLLLRTDAIDPENDTALSRLEETKKLMYVSVRDPSFLPINWIMTNIGPLLPKRILRKVFVLKGFTSSFSNIAGPQMERFTACNGKATGVETLFWVPDRSPMGMGVSSAGYMDDVAFGLIVDKALMKNYREAYQFLDDMMQEFENLRKELALDDYKK